MDTRRLHRKSRRLDRKIAAIAAVLGAMRAGRALRLHFGSSGAQWRLTNGMRVTPEVARIIISDPHVTPCDGTLFRECAAQTWRYTETSSS
jgi:hypothetical protein